MIQTPCHLIPLIHDYTEVKYFKTKNKQDQMWAVQSITYKNSA